MSGALGGAPCAFIVPGVDLARSFVPRASDGPVRPSGASSWRGTWNTPRRRRAANPVPPRANDEVLICYGARACRTRCSCCTTDFWTRRIRTTSCRWIGLRAAARARVGTPTAGRALSDEGDERARVGREVHARPWRIRRARETRATPSVRRGDGPRRRRRSSAGRPIGGSAPGHRRRCSIFPTRMEMCVRYRMLQKQNARRSGGSSRRSTREAAKREKKRAMGSRGVVE